MRIYPLTKNCTVIELYKPTTWNMLVELSKVILRLIKEQVPEIRIKIIE